MGTAKQTTKARTPAKKVLNENLERRKVALEENGWQFNLEKGNAAKHFFGEEFVTRISGANSVTELMEMTEAVEQMRAKIPETVAEIEISKIAVSRFDPQARRRLRFTDENLQPLAESLKTRGLKQSILLRPIAVLDNLKSITGGKAEFEIVFGERRTRAAMKNGWQKIRAVIENLTDAETVELQYDENHQRQENYPLDDAFLFKFLVKNENYTEEMLADRFNKKLREVKEILSLNNLISDAAKQLEDGDLPLKHAIYLSTFPENTQKEIVENDYAYKYGDFDEGAASLKEFKEEVADNIIRKLENAPFDTENPVLHESAKGLKCSQCPKRSSVEPLLFPELQKEDSCLDPNCWDFKSKVHLKLTRERIAEKLVPAANDKPVEEIVKEVQLVTERSWVEKQEIPFKEKVQTNQKLLDEPECEFSTLSLAVEGAKKGQEVYVCNETNCPVHNPKTEVNSDDNKKEEEKIRVLVHERILTRSIEFFDDYHTFWQFDDLVNEIIYQMFSADRYDTRNKILKIVADWGIFQKKWDYTPEFRADFKERLKKLDKRRQSQLLFLLIKIREGFYATYNQDGLKKLALDYAKRDYSEFEREVREELEGKNNER